MTDLKQLSIWMVPCMEIKIEETGVEKPLMIFNGEKSIDYNEYKKNT
jgi:hypothetical protein